MEFIIFIIIGVFAGWVAEQVMKREHGLIINLIVGVVGALLGGLLANLIGLEVAGIVGQTVVAILGAILLLFLLGLIRRKPRAV